MQKLECNT